MKIDAILYAYKSKSLKLVVDTLLENTTSQIRLYVFDQNPIKRSEMFMDSRIVYEHLFWDAIQSPNEKRGDIIDKSDADYILHISDDCLVSPAWDEKLIDFIGRKQIVVSGKGNVKLFKKDHFSIGASWEYLSDFSMTNYIDRNFIFSTNEVWNSIVYPYYLKYNGEEEMLSLDFFRSGKDIYCSTKETYKDLGHRVLERSYVPFSIDHNYNKVVETLTSTSSDLDQGFQRTRDDFLSFHNMLPLDIVELPYQTNDVGYNPYGLTFQDIDARKFIANTKAIY